MANKRQVQIILAAASPDGSASNVRNYYRRFLPPRQSGRRCHPHSCRWEANRHARTVDALLHRTHTETALFDAQMQAIASYMTAARVPGTPGAARDFPNDRECRRVEREEHYQKLRHPHQVAEARRLIELAQVERELVDAQQALKAQRDHGYGRYELEWKKRSCEMLDVELSAAERRAILQQHLAELDRSESADGASTEKPSDAPIDDALYEARLNCWPTASIPAGSMRSSSAAE